MEARSIKVNLKRMKHRARRKYFISIQTMGGNIRFPSLVAGLPEPTENHWMLWNITVA